VPTELMPGVVDTDGRFDAAVDHLIPWIEQVAPLRGKTVLEDVSDRVALSPSPNR
jgi:hypothetical protein